MKFSRLLFLLVLLAGLAIPAAYSLKPHAQPVTSAKVDCCPVPQCPPLCPVNDKLPTIDPLTLPTFSK